MKLKVTDMLIIIHDINEIVINSLIWKKISLLSGIKIDFFVKYSLT